MTDRTEANELFTSADEVMHFGFECNFHALVFFADVRQVAVKKWQTIWLGLD